MIIILFFFRQSFTNNIDDFTMFNNMTVETPLAISPTTPDAVMVMKRKLFSDTDSREEAISPTLFRHANKKVKISTKSAILDDQKPLKSPLLGLPVVPPSPYVLDPSKRRWTAKINLISKHRRF